MRITLRHFFIALLLSSSTSYAQTWQYLRHEVFGGIGGSNFLGELGGANQIGTNGLKDLEISLTNPNLNLGYRIIANQHFAFKAMFTQGWVSGNDAKTQEFFRQNRNLNFRSPISELDLCIEYYPFKERIQSLYRMKGVKGKREILLSPYFVAGIGGFYFNPKQKYDGKWYKLHKMHTEGQGLPDGPAQYKRMSLAIPIGFGVKYALDKFWSIGFEMMGRKTFTDYIDDVSTVYYDSDALATIDPMAPVLANPALDKGTYGYVTATGMQRGDPTDKDSYVFAIFSVHYRLLKYRMHLPKL